MFYLRDYDIFEGNFQGELLLNGRPVSEEEMIKISGFVGQDDVSFVELTVLEQLNLMVSMYSFSVDRLKYKIKIIKVGPVRDIF